MLFYYNDMYHIVSYSCNIYFFTDGMISCDHLDVMEVINMKLEAFILSGVWAAAGCRWF